MNMTLWYKNLTLAEKQELRRDYTAATVHKEKEFTSLGQEWLTKYIYYLFEHLERTYGKENVP